MLLSAKKQRLEVNNGLSISLHPLVHVHLYRLGVCTQC